MVLDIRPARSIDCWSMLSVCTGWSGFDSPSPVFGAMLGAPTTGLRYLSDSFRESLSSWPESSKGGSIFNDQLTLGVLLWAKRAFYIAVEPHCLLDWWAIWWVWIPSYLVSSALEISFPSMHTGRQVRLRTTNDTCIAFFSVWHRCSV